MANDLTKPSRRVLSPNERIAEVIFGLIMVLTFTGSLSIADAGRDDVRAMLIGALGCNIAWGIIDGVLYLMGCLSDRGQNLKTLLAVRKITEPEKAHGLISGALPPMVASLLKPEELTSLHQRIKELPEPPATAKLGTSDWFGALGVFLLVFLTTFPVTIPFMLMHNNLPLAMRLSNGIALAMLLLCGFIYGKHVGRSPWGFGIGLMVLGMVLVGMTIALGG